MYALESIKVRLARLRWRCHKVDKNFYDDYADEVRIGCMFRRVVPSGYSFRFINQEANTFPDIKSQASHKTCFMMKLLNKTFGERRKKLTTSL